MRIFAEYRKDAVADIIFLCPDINRDYEIDFWKGCAHPLAHMHAVTPEPHNIVIVESSGPDFKFSASVHAAIPHTRTGFLVIYSDDVFPEEGWLSGMLEAFQTDPKLGICGAVQYARNPNPGPGNADNRMTHIGGRFDEANVIAYQLPTNGADPAEKHLVNKWCGTWPDGETAIKDKIIYSDWVNGAIMGIPRRIWDEIGGLDMHFSFFWDDVDICWRARRAGYGVGVHYDVLCVHVGGATVCTMSQFSQERSRHIMMDKMAEMREAEE
jgi:GT2 family glycosyltransferase